MEHELSQDSKMPESFTQVPVGPTDTDIDYIGV
jgi:hypothetical protein